MDWSQYHRIFSTFTTERLSISDFIISVLKHSEDFDSQFQSLIDDLFTRTGEILAAFALQQKSTEISKKWAHTLACQLYMKDIDRLLQTETGLHFNISNASHDQITSFNSDTLIQCMSSNAPRLWELICTILSARKARSDTEEHEDEFKVLKLVSTGQYSMHICTFNLIYIMLSEIGGPHRKYIVLKQYQMQSFAVADGDPPAYVCDTRQSD